MTGQVAVVIQARTSSRRLPGKVLAEIGEKPMIKFLIERLSHCRNVDSIILATTDEHSDNELAELCNTLGIEVSRGNNEDVLSRFSTAVENTNAETIVRITGDCPLSDPTLIDEMINIFCNNDYDYYSNVCPPTYPDGLDVEIFTREVLELANSQCNDNLKREHVTSWMRDMGNIKIGNKYNSRDDSNLRWTVDEPEDLIVVQHIISHFENRTNFSWEQVYELYQQSPEIFSANARFSRNEGMSLSNGQKLWRRAKRIIPGGNMLLSKRAEMFLPGHWPSYFSKAKGCRVWDLDGRELIDMSIMGIGTNLLGYGHPEVDDAVLNTISLGNMSTLNCPEEVLLAEKLIEIHPWADMARFARSGGEANAIAIRIARAATGRDTIAICGYHGWHDWYLATNLQNSSGLEEHLLPGLEPNGVPKGLTGSVQPFTYNRLDQLEEISSKYELAAVKMEVQRTIPPAKGFIEGIRSLCNRKNIILIFDECTSGFRETFGGLHKKYGVDPDMAMFGKALGNGYAITATIGKRAVMEAAQSSFISSTFWTERIGPTAALKTLEVMERERSWEQVTATGHLLRQQWQNIADNNVISITQNGLPALAGFSFSGERALEYKTLITQEMLKRGYLASTSCYSCLAHTPEIIKGYIEALDEVFGLISECERGEQQIESLLEGPTCHSGFQRLN